jgi:hypothetical protein
MEGLLSLTKKTSPFNFYYICEKNGDSLSDKVKSTSQMVVVMLVLHIFLKVLGFLACLRNLTTYR